MHRRAHISPQCTIKQSLQADTVVYRGIYWDTSAAQFPWVQPTEISTKDIGLSAFKQDKSIIFSFLIKGTGK